ncbi:MAG: hypothetical protein ACFFG0_02605 [Candidatus Thorarchaeota archaeon]
MASKIDIIFERRNSELAEKQSNWELIFNSYVGGVAFSNAGYLIRYPKESIKSFTARKERAVYFNQVSPIVDMLSGLLFLNKPTRNISKDMEYLLTNVSRSKSLNEFSRLAAAYSFMFTCGVLIDTPQYDPQIIKTRKDRIDNKINPYAILYLPFKIRDFSINNVDGELDWIILDDSYIENSDPFIPQSKVIKYTLWKRETYQIFEKEERTGIIKEYDEVPHKVGYVPFKFISWRDDNNDFVGETVCEDIAMISKLIYNDMSYMDEMLASGTFKMLAYPSRSGEIPPEMKHGGVGPLSIIPYDGNFSTQPSFIGADLAEIDPFLKAINFYMSEILKKVGLNTDETKEFVKSGAAKKIDFQKMRSLLIAGALMMGSLEEWIIETASRLDGKKNIETKCEYTTAFSDEDLESEVTMLTELLVQPVKELRVNVLNILAKKLLTNYLDQDKLELIYKDIKKSIGGDEPFEKTPVEKNSDQFKASVEGSVNKILEEEQGDES